MKEYKIGDNLQVIALTEDSDKVKIGDIGVIVRIEEDDDYPIRMNINDIYDYGFKYEEIDYPKSDLDIKELAFNMYINDVEVHPDNDNVLRFDTFIYIDDIYISKRTNKKFNRCIDINTYNLNENRRKDDSEIESELIDKVKKEVRRIYLNEKKYNLPRYRKTNFSSSIEVRE